MDRNMLISNSKLTLSFIFDKVDLVFFEYMEKEIEWIVCVERERLYIHCASFQVPMKHLQKLSYIR